MLQEGGDSADSIPQYCADASECNRAGSAFCYAFVALQCIRISSICIVVGGCVRYVRRHTPHLCSWRRKRCIHQVREQEANERHAIGWMKEVLYTENTA